MKDSFVAQYAAHLWVASLGVTGPFGALLALIVSAILGSLMDRGIVVIDITIDKLSQALKEKQWRQAALTAYTKAAKRVYTEEEKHAIRIEYLEALQRYAANSRVRDGG